MGDECPNGSSVFQITFSPGPNVNGRSAVSAIPEPFGPRKRDHSSGAAARVCTRPAATPSIVAIPTTRRIQLAALLIAAPVACSLPAPRFEDANHPIVNLEPNDEL